MNEALLRKAYQAFNARDIDAVLAILHPDVAWSNGMEGGYVHGHNEVRDYWSRQWCLIDPHVEPQCFTINETGQTVMNLHQVVRDLDGNVIVNQIVQHLYAIEHS
ncbi:MAG: nuclear transport factor 2 family protein [Tildeniella nuda ZEHNDER 1965/U140]|jgi:ketosteroid isomerase-like protein|nr:nuclear transport factor 2 family protein [Tildeniella nuda ZEHNDER 1965/U140]